MWRFLRLSRKTGAILRKPNQIHNKPMLTYTIRKLKSVSQKIEKFSTEVGVIKE